MYKIPLKSSIPLIAFILFTSNVNAGIFDGCFGSKGYKPISAEKLKAKADISAKHMGICYETAICLARAEGALDKKQESYLLGTLNLKGGDNYSEGYKTIMELNDGSLAKPSLDINGITESGFVNFHETARNKFVHTAYIQVTRNGEKFLYNANNTVIDRVLTVGDTAEFTLAGRALRHPLNADKVAKFNSWLEESGHKIYYTPSREVTGNIMSAMSAPKA
jgi:hypothetical protein